MTDSQPAPMPPAPPVEIRWLTDTIGVEATLLFLDTYGGSRVYIPARPTSDSPLTKAMGLETAQQLGRLVGKQTIPVPLAKRWRSLTYRAKGWSAAKIARKLNIAEYTVSRHAKPQADRFDQLKLNI